MVDDDRVALTVLCAMLRAAGAEVDGVGSGTEGLDRLRKGRYDFLLCDVYMTAIFAVVGVHVWATFGMAPAIMFVTGSIMWWNRVVRRRRTTSDVVVEPAIQRSEVIVGGASAVVFQIEIGRASCRERV